MSTEVEFKVGETYTNRREQYTVLALTPPMMRVRYEDGREGTLEIATQQRIVRNMLLPPRTPEPPPRPARGSLAASRAAAARSRPAKAKTPGSTRTAAAGGNGAQAPAPDEAATPRKRRTVSGRPAEGPSSLTLAQLSEMERADRRERLTGVLASREAFVALLERSSEAEQGRFRLYTPDHVSQLQQAEPPPGNGDPQGLLGYAVMRNRAGLADPSQKVLARRYPLLEGGVERYIIDLLCYDEAAGRPILVQTRVKSTQRQWLWDGLLEALRNWVAFTRAANLAEALDGFRIDAPSLPALLAPAAYWAENRPDGASKGRDIEQNLKLNSSLLTAVRGWWGVEPLLLQVPDTWLRAAGQPGEPDISAAPEL